jgi:uncharacterized circularly permuted ATP-grasp superfamily protein
MVEQEFYMLEEHTEQMKKFWDIFSQQKLYKIKEFDTFMEKFAVNFNLYKDGKFVEQFLPFDVIPRIITNKMYIELESGLQQRVKALNMFLEDIYTEQRIISEGIIPEHFVYEAEGYQESLKGHSPVNGIRTHISGIDLVHDSVSGKWIILEDNLRVPSGVSYPLSVRNAYRRIYPEFFEKMHIRPIDVYPQMLKETIDYVNCGGINVVLTPGRFNSAYYEHSYLAEKIGAVLVRGDELVVDDKILYFKHFDGQRVKVGAVYRRLDDEFLDPEYYNSDSLIGVPGIMEAYFAGNVSILDAPGNGVADDKGIYYFVPDMIRFYLGEEPILENAPTYLPYFEKDMTYVLDHISELVIKDVAEAGGYGVQFGNKLTTLQQEDLKTLIKKNPRRFIAQELIEFFDEECYLNEQLVPRKADFRAYVTMTDKVSVWPCGLTRYAKEEGNYLVNSSQGGGFKDTWVLEDKDA